MKPTKKTGTSIEHNRFYLIVSKIHRIVNDYGQNYFSTQYKFIVAAYSWIDEFAKAQKSRANAESQNYDYYLDDYQKNIIYNGIGYAISDDICLDFGLLNTQENRKKAAEDIADKFPDFLDENDMKVIVATAFNYLKNEYSKLLSQSTVNKIQNPEKLQTQIQNYLIEPLKIIENPYEQLAGILIYAQSGSLPLDVYKLELDKAIAQNKELRAYQEKYAVPSQLPKCLYHCDFWGYFYNSKNVHSGKIDTFKLRISSDRIQLSIFHYAENAGDGNKQTTSEHVLEGRIIHNQSSETVEGPVVLSFHSQKNNFFCVMAFNAIAPNHTLHYRKGALMIQKRGDKLPVIQSFIFTRQKMDLSVPDKLKCVQGLLKLNSKKIFLDKQKASEYLESDIVKEYIEKGHQIVQREFSEMDDSILLELISKDADKYLSLLKIRADSLFPPLFQISEDTDSFHYIADLYCGETDKESNSTE